MKLKHRISFVSGEVIPANVELTKDQVKKAKTVGGKFHDEPKEKPKKESKEESNKELKKDGGE